MPPQGGFRYMIGQTLGRFRILEKAGTGGMGVVYRARDEGLGRDVALKVLTAELTHDPGRLSRFEREARAASALNHPHIITIYEIGRHQSIPYIAMEWIAGPTLGQRMAGGPLPARELLHLAAQISIGLAKAHEAGIIHRDLKPSNIMVTREGSAKILDFGLAKLASSRSEESEGQRATAADVRTLTGAVIGTPQYMSPEQARGQAVDAASDQFSLGVILHEMATGRHPFERDSAVQTMAAIITDKPVPIRQVNPSVPEAFESAVMRCMRKVPSDRYPSTAELAHDLEQIRLTHVMDELRPPSASRATAPGAPVLPARTRRARVALAGILPLLALALAYGWWQVARGPARPTVPAAGSATPSRPTLAVLPFRALTREASDSELGLGIADAIITGLGGSSELIVRPTRTVLAYQDKTTDPIEAGKALQASAVLDGTVQRSGKRVRITVQLWRVSDGVSLWTQKYDIESGDIFDVQDKIGTSAAQSLRVQLGEVARARLGAVPSKDPNVYLMLLRGRNLELRQGRESLQAAIALYQEAVQKEPANALAHARFGFACRLFGFLYDPNNPTWLKKAELHSRHALELDPNLAEAYAAEAGVLWTPQRHFQHDRAAALYRKALELNPNLATERGFYSVILTHVGLFEQAATQFQRALEIDPENLRALASVAEAHFMQGEPRRGEEAARAALRADPDYPLAKMALLDALVAQGKLDEAEVLLQRNYLKPGYFTLWFAGLIAARRGRYAEAESLGLRAVNEAQGLGPYHHLAYGLAEIYGLSGKKADAVRWLRRTAESGMPCYPLFRDDPMLKNLRGDPGYEKLLAEMRRDWERRQREY